MGRRTRREQKRRHKRLMRIHTLLEDGTNRKTRIRELMNLSRTDLARMDAKEASHAEQA